jgi:hypothetical protein
MVGTTLTKERILLHAVIPVTATLHNAVNSFACTLFPGACATISARLSTCKCRWLTLLFGAMFMSYVPALARARTRRRSGQAKSQPSGEYSHIEGDFCVDLKF